MIGKFFKKINLTIIFISILLTASTIFYNVNYKSMELDSDVQVEVTSSNFATLRLLKLNDVTYKTLAQEISFEDIIEEYKLISFEVIGKGFRYSTFDRLTPFKEIDIENLHFNLKKRKGDINRDVLQRINEGISIFTNEALENIYGNILDSSNTLQQLDDLYSGLDGNNKLKSISVKLAYKKSYLAIDRKRFEDSRDIQDFKDMYTIGFNVFQVKDSTYEKFTSISYMDLLIIIITMFIIYLSLYLFNTKVRKHVTLDEKL